LLLIKYAQQDAEPKNKYLWMLRCGNTVLLTLRFLDVAMFTTLTPLSLLVLRSDSSLGYKQRIYITVVSLCSVQQSVTAEEGQISNLGVGRRVKN
jgi:hypothetical protein